MKHIHFIAIGGKAMHNLALTLSQKGYQITGSDDEIYDPSRSRLEAAGLLPENMGWHPEKISRNIDAIILGMHARPDNPELKKALELGIEVYSYPEFLYRESLSKKRIAICGSHGKTTTTAMVMHSLKEADLDIDFMVGAQIDGYERMVRLTDAPIIVLEGDEYLSSPIDRRPKFLHYHPHIAVITGIAWDHINVFPTFIEYTEQFLHLIHSIESGGTLIYYCKDQVLVDLVESIDRPDIQLIPYDTEQLNELNEVYLDNKWFKLPIIGMHNYQNMLASRKVASLLGISEAKFAKAMESFQGVSRRLQLIFEEGGTKLFLDYAHAPSKVKATTDAIKSWYPDRTVIACFELHTFSSLNKDFIPQYKDALDLADEAIVYYDLHTIEMKQMDLLDHNEIRRGFNRKDLHIINKKDELSEKLIHLKDEESIFLMMSSGSFSGMNLKNLLIS